MKTKIIKSKGYWRLVVQDEEVNQQYDCTNKNPVVLGVLTEFFDSGCWALSDYRLSKHRFPSPYLEEAVQIYHYENEKEKNKVIEYLHTYEISEKEKCIIWSKFDSYAFDGDNPSHTDKYGEVYSTVARFSFKEGLNRLKQQKEFWENYDKKDLKSDEIRIENIHRQPGETEIYFKIELSTPKKKKM